MKQSPNCTTFLRIRTSKNALLMRIKNPHKKGVRSLYSYNYTLNSLCPVSCVLCPVSCVLCPVSCVLKIVAPLASLSSLFSCFPSVFLSFFKANGESILSRYINNYIREEAFMSTNFDWHEIRHESSLRKSGISTLQQHLLHLRKYFLRKGKQKLGIPLHHTTFFVAAQKAYHFVVEGKLLPLF